MLAFMVRISYISHIHMDIFLPFTYCMKAVQGTLIEKLEKHSESTDLRQAAHSHVHKRQESFKKSPGARW